MKSLQGCKGNLPVHHVYAPSEVQVPIWTGNDNPNPYGDAAALARLSAEVHTSIRLKASRALGLVIHARDSSAFVRLNCR